MDTATFPSFPVQIVYQKLHSSKPLEQYIRAQAQKLTQYFNHILNCRVLVEILNRHAAQGKLFHVHVDLNLPHRKLVVNRCPTKNHAHEDAFVTIRDAFIALKRKLQQYVQKLKGRIKHHEVVPHGWVSHILPQAEHGFIESSDGRNIYFTKNSVVDGSFKQLNIGSEVRFAEAANQSSRLSASTVKRIKKHHL